MKKKLKLKKGIIYILIFYIFVACFVLLISNPQDKPKDSIKINIINK